MSLWSHLCTNCWTGEISENDYPSWWRKLDKEYFWPGGLTSHLHSILDHAKPEGEKLIAASYSTSFEEIKRLVHLCEEHNLEVTLNGACEYHPDTFKVEIEPKKDK